MRRHQDWLRQAQRKLDSAHWDIEGQFYEDACFSAQQAAELAVKALLKENQRRTEIGIYQLLGHLEEVDPEVLDAARMLDHYYVQTRYPDLFPAGAPMDYYNSEVAEGAVQLAQRIIEFAANRIEITLHKFTRRET